MKHVLLFQYIIMVPLSVLPVIVQWDNIFSMDILWLLLMIFWWIVWYFWIYFLLSSFSKLNVWLSISIANLYILFSYIVNYIIFPNEETVSVGKLITWLLIFILVVSYILYQNKKDLKFTKFVIYPLLVAICWTIFFSLSNYIIKTWISTFSITTFYFHLFMLVTWIIYIFIWKESFNIQKFKIQRKHIYFSINSILLLTWVYLLFLWFYYYPANIINIFKLIDIIITTVFWIIFFKEKVDNVQKFMIIWTFLLFITYYLIN